MAFICLLVNLQAPFLVKDFAMVALNVLTRGLAEWSSFFFFFFFADNDVNSYPYESEILSLLENSSSEFDFISSERNDFTLSDTYIWVETASQLEELVDVLNKETVFAVDTEQHSLRSFLGFTALVQVNLFSLALSLSHTHTLSLRAFVHVN